MADEGPGRRRRDERDLLDAVERKEARKLAARRHGRRSIAFGLGLFGVVGWSVAIPTLVGIALGLYLDRVAPLGFSWTLTLMIVGVAAGALMAWQWLQREGRRRDDDEEGT
ncbi:MAG: AtpZ/AtpI family protein [Deinococcales bacterium]|jgi:ATP synthase protein I